MRIVSIIALMLVTGCTSVSEQLATYQRSQIEVVPRIAYAPESTEGQLHQQIELLARQLFDTANQFDVNGTLIIGTFLPAGSLDPQQGGELAPYGIQLQESFTTLSTQAGLKVAEYKMLPAVKVSDNADIMLSRNVSELRSNIKADYMLNGTYMQQQNSLIVNARLISVKDQKVIAAATDYIPMTSLWSHSKVKQQNGQLYRGEY